MNIYCNTNSNPSPIGNNTNDYIPPKIPRFQGKCNYCRKWGYRGENCWFLKNNQFRNAERTKVVEEEVVLINKMPTTRNEELGLNEIRNNVWLAD